MSLIRLATPEDIPLLIELGRSTFLDAHSLSASKLDLEEYLDSKYKEEIIAKELKDDKVFYHLLFDNSNAIANSKLIIDLDPIEGLLSPICKLDRLYLRREFYGLQYANLLFEFNRNLAKSLHQEAMVLYVWTENHRAIRFYEKLGFEKIGSYDFKISAKHSNPNHFMYLGI